MIDKDEIDGKSKQLYNELIDVLEDREFIVVLGPVAAVVATMIMGHKNPQYAKRLVENTIQFFMNQMRAQEEEDSDT